MAENVTKIIISAQHCFEFLFENLTKHSDNIFFHRWGIGEVDSDALYQRAMRDYAYRKKYGDKKLDELRKWKVSENSKRSFDQLAFILSALTYVQP